jgi:hypothetical protein
MSRTIIFADEYGFTKKPINEGAYVVVVAMKAQLNPAQIGK